MAYNLRVCFFVLFNNKFLNEKETVQHLSEIAQAVKSGEIDILTMDGAVSISFNNEELLGVEFWDSVNRMYTLPHLLLEGKPRNVYLPYQTCWLRLKPQGKQLLYELESVAKSRTWHIIRSLPLEPFVREWSLMWFRLLKLEAYLGSQSAISVIKGWRNAEFATEKWRRVVNEDRLNLIVSQDLEYILLKGEC